MTVVISNHDTPLPLPGGPTLRPGARTNVEHWERLKNNDIVKAWVSAGLITVEADETSTVDEDKGEKKRKA
ncbi:MAG: hypothetical protein LCH99_25760 [Proteobacteria bacterium]|nr:hypothetical protein [Pseudomonadota bacterium]